MPLLETVNVAKRFPVRSGFLKKTNAFIRAVDGVSLAVEAGQTLGLVGESGCGKTTLGRLVLGLLRADDGKLLFDGKPLQEWIRAEPGRLREQLQVVFQDPFDSLDPRWTMAQSMAEPLQAVKRFSRGQISERLAWAIREVQLPEHVLGQYPHELSGGQRQRIGIARALIVRPRLVVLDEPVSSLDLSVQMQVLGLLHRLRAEHRIAYLFISHDLGAVERMSDRVAVMYLGKVVESGPTAEMMSRPWHPYTEALLASIPKPDPEQARPIQPLSGEVPSASEIPSGCRFRTRCPLAQERCAREEPALEQKAPGRFVACHFRP